MAKLDTADGMAFTDNCSLFGAVHEDGVNRVIRHIMRQRPSLFNYATADVAANAKLWCTKVDHTADVTKYGNPLFTIMDPLPVFGADAPPVGLGFIAQLVKAEIDFHKGNTILLPAELNPPLPAQRFALHFRACASIECPSPRLVDHIPVGGGPEHGKRDQPPKPPIVLPGSTNCFCLDVYAIGEISHEVVAGRDSLVARVDDMDIVDIKPEALEDNLICYLKTTVNVVLREKLTVAIETLMVRFPLFGLATITLSPTPNPPVPNNPAIEDDELKVFITMTV
jgi:hypothetical protein